MWKLLMSYLIHEAGALNLFFARAEALAFVLGLKIDFY